ncbi:Glutamate receptor [Quillaja saponaria]|uniref:Glutamate receptor n=1 Tax=Quillaja saponaria TaxID=32244 RepID=A0AAD7QGV2_QUISA|nr:Glutamate receptor [Quillaja saponaria]
MEQHSFVLPIILLWVLLSGFVHCQTPAVVKIGAVFTFDSVIGRAAKVAIEAAVSDVNADPRILNGTELRLIMEDANCSVFLGSIGAFQVLEKGVVAIIGPQSSAIAHMISQIANGLQVPLISYAATDPTLSALQFPFFLRTVPSESEQMAAMADLIDFYGWKEVIAIYVDDDYGRNGISALGDELEKKKSRISHKLPLPINFDLGYVSNLLNGLKVFGTRVYVLHINPDPRLRIFRVVYKLQMLTSNYVWLATDWLSATLDSFSSMDKTSLSILQGVVGLRPHTPDSIQKRDFASRWIKMQREAMLKSGLNSYSLYAYDTVWTIARSIDEFIKVHKNITFSSNINLLGGEATEIQFDKLKVFDGGSHLVSILLEAKFTGVSGLVQFNSDRNIISGGYNVININQMAITEVGYWSNYSGFSVVPPETLEGKKENERSNLNLDQKLNNVTWPGGKTDRPRGWVVSGNERPLRIGVPKRASFVEFVTEQHDTHKIEGYCIDVFMEARKLVPYDVPFTFKPFGDGHSNPNYDALVKMVAEDVFDAAVGDIAIVTNRTRIVDFSQPFATTGLVIVAPIQNAKSRINDDFRGPPKRQLVTMLLFSFSTLFKTNQEKTVSPLARMVMIVWLFLLMVMTASYTASLTSILTVQQLSSPFDGIDSLIASNWPIGYQVGSFAYSYLTDSLYIASSRLVPLASPEAYERALQQGPTNGGVAAIIDELPYVELFLSEQTDFGIIGQTFTKSGWGFAFQRDSPLAIDMSNAILKLSENGDLQKIHEKWFCKMGCPGEMRHDSESDQLHLISFWGLYLWCGIFSLAALLVFLFRTVCQFVKYKRRQNEPPTPSSLESSGNHCSQVIYNFFDFIDEKEEAIKKIFTQFDNPSGQS